MTSESRVSPTGEAVFRARREVLDHRENNSRIPSGRIMRSVPARVGPELWAKVTAGGSETDCVETLERTVDGILETLSGERFDRENGDAAQRILPGNQPAPYMVTWPSLSYQSLC